MSYNIIIFLVYLCGGLARGTALNNLNVVLIQMYSHVAAKFTVTSQIIALLSISVLCGSILGTFSATPIILKFGRKNSILYMALISLLSSVTSMIPVHYVYLGVNKIVTGFSTSIIMTAIPMLFSEFVAPNLRGVFGSFMNLFICVGVLISSVIQLLIAPHDKLFYISFIPGTVSCVLLIVLLFWVKESNTQKHATPLNENKIKIQWWALEMLF
ncbi:Sugar_(And other) transporter family protein [Hexamita inflata]|uniref:Sugar (And other) transporter family protein n=1 Tax=Hexamita inflata TaxID=28002 RepID=A0AA86U228_9EUKA|nr:Sugar (And other) transporter family protein [Hexamita inflata]